MIRQLKPQVYANISIMCFMIGSTALFWFLLGWAVAPAGRGAFSGFEFYGGYFLAIAFLAQHLAVKGFKFEATIQHVEFKRVEVIPLGWYLFLALLILGYPLFLFGEWLADKLVN